MKQATAARIGIALMEKGKLLYSWTKKDVANLLTEQCRDEKGKKFNSLESAMKNDAVKTDLIGKEQKLLTQVEAIINLAINPP